MTHEKPYLLGLNVGSSSITFALYHSGEPPKRRLHGKVDRIGMHGTVIATDTSRVDVRVIHTDEEL